MITGATAASIQSQINYTREHELEADRIGFQRLTDAGFDPRAMASFFDRLQKATRLVEGNTPGYLRTHPLTHERVAEAEDRAFNAPYRQIRDSVEFHMVRALLRSYEGEPREAVARLEKELVEGRYRDARAARYGLAAALLRAKAFTRAEAEIAVLNKGGERHPMVEALTGQVLLQSGRLVEARQHYESALARFPDHLQLVYDYPQVLLRQKAYQEAIRFAEARLSSRPEDGSLHQIVAEAASALGQGVKSHRHQGEYEAARGNLPGALEQFQIAVRLGKGDDHDLQIAEIRLKSLRELQKAADRNNRERNGLMPLPTLTPR